MAFVVKKNISGKDYYYLNQNKRVGDKVKTKTLAYLGKSKEEAEKKAKEIINNLQKEISSENKTEKKQIEIKSELKTKNISIEELAKFCKKDF